MRTGVPGGKGDREFLLPKWTAPSVWAFIVPVIQAPLPWVVARTGAPLRLVSARPFPEESHVAHCKCCNRNWLKALSRGEHSDHLTRVGTLGGEAVA